MFVKWLRGAVSSLTTSLIPDALLKNVVCGVLSAQAGKPVGYRFRKLVEVAHHLASRYPAALLPFGFALRGSGNDATIEREDQTGSWKRRRDRIRAAIKAGDPSYGLQLSMKKTLNFLFPALRLS
jgi:hypothetical protein